MQRKNRLYAIMITTVFVLIFTLVFALVVTMHAFSIHTGLGEF